jgi:hypothetical protein
MDNDRGSIMMSFSRSFGQRLVLIVCIILLNSCSHPSPNSSDLNKRLQSQIPEYLEIVSLDVEKSEISRTSNSSEVIQKIHAKAKLKEDTFVIAGKRVDIPLSNQEGIVFIAIVGKQGNEIDLHGFSTSKANANNGWTIDFSLNQDIINRLGKPRNSFSGNIMVRNSKEENELIDKAKMQVKEEEKKLNLIKKSIKSAAWMMGEWQHETVNLIFENNEERQDNTFGKRNFEIRFRALDESTGDLTGELKFPTSTSEFRGKLEEKKISFEVGSIVNGKDYFGPGMQFSLSFETPSTMRGRWEHTGSVTLPDGAVTNTIKTTGSASFGLKN